MALTVKNQGFGFYMDYENDNQDSIEENCCDGRYYDTSGSDTVFCIPILCNAYHCAPTKSDYGSNGKTKNAAFIEHE